MRLIDGDALSARIMEDVPDFLDGGSSITKAFILAMLATRSVTPTIDAVPVVRCNDCKHATMTSDGKMCKYCEIDTDDFGDQRDVYHDADWFCADGERR
jgi:hypothetical protein